MKSRRHCLFVQTLA